MVLSKIEGNPYYMDFLVEYSDETKKDQYINTTLSKICYFMERYHSALTN